jgi:predicted amino acid racemase
MKEVIEEVIETADQVIETIEEVIETVETVSVEVKKAHGILSRLLACFRGEDRV